MKKYLKIGVVAFPSYGGSGAVATELGKKIAQLGHKVHFIMRDVPFRLIGPWRKNIFFHQVESLEYPVLSESPYTITLANKIAEIAVQEKLDIVHTHYALPHVVAGYLAREMTKRRFKLVCTLHGTDVTITGADPIVRDAVSFSLSRADAVTAVAGQLADEAKRTFELKRKPAVIHNFVEPKQPSPEQIEELHRIFANEDQKIIIHVSNFRSVKRIQDVVRVFAEIHKRVPSKLLLVGDGPDQRAAYKLAAKLQLIPHLHFMGLQSQVEKLLSIADLFLLPSEREGLSLAALEAMALGIPVIVTSVGGMPELIAHGENGFLAEVGDVPSMAASGIRVLTDDAFHAQISRAAKQTVTEGFSPSIIVPKYEALYRSLVPVKS
ncbi:N-acetyl-alpha-D-glucosaminyl L-malate synthase BshA [Candidatus Berkelbacteria bacterium]|nr:N-acetyl-alpha-D-glucosaminyl L-malate synthase BshA [Candidatus Berkelbacteria bacterium]